MEFRAAIEIFPDDADAHYNLGLALDSLGEPDQALGEFRRAAQLRPASSLIHFQLGLSSLANRNGGGYWRTSPSYQAGSNIDGSALQSCPRTGWSGPIAGRHIGIQAGDPAAA